MRSAFFNPRTQLIIGIALLILLFVFYLWFVSTNLTTTFDDAYMFMRYADNMLAGLGVSWNPDGIQTYGATSLLYLFVIVAARGLFSWVDGGTVLVVTSAVFGMASLVLMAVGCARLSSSDVFKKYPLLFPTFLAALFFLSPDFLFHATSGMDTTLALFCNVLLIFATLNWVKINNVTSLILLILAGYASFLARPDNLIYAVLFPVLCGFFFLGEDRMKRIAAFLAGFAAVLALDTGVKYMIFGDPLPLPFYAKTAGYDDGYAGAVRWNPISYIFSFGALMLPFLLILVFSASKSNRLLAVSFLIPMLMTFAYFFSVVQIMGFGARYYFPSVPFFVIDSFLLLDGGLQESAGTNLIKQPVRAAAALLLIVFLFFSPIQTTLEQAYKNAFIPSITDDEIARELPELGWWQAIHAVAEICAQLPAGTKVAMTEYGLAGAEASQIHIIDPLGLHDPFFAHNGFSPVEFFARKPDLIWFPHPDYTGIVASIQGSPNLVEEYDYYPGAFDYGIAIRRDAGDSARIYETIASAWETAYPGLALESYKLHQP
jgi:hypothetical protein